MESYLAKSRVPGNGNAVIKRQPQSEQFIQ